MYYSIKGVVSNIFSNYITLINNDITYKIYTPKPNYYKPNDEISLFTHLLLKETGLSLYGFNDIEEKELFLCLLTCKGVGPKTAINILKDINYMDLIHAINIQDLNFINSITTNKKIINSLLALKNKVKKLDKINNSEIDKVKKVKDALLSLGFSNNEINEAFIGISVYKDSEEELLKLILSKIRK